METATPTQVQNPAPAATGSSPSLIVTSNASRTQYGNDVATLQNATSSLKPAASNIGSYKGVPITGGSQVDIENQIKAIDTSMSGGTKTTTTGTNSTTMNQPGSGGNTTTSFSGNTGVVPNNNPAAGGTSTVNDGTTASTKNGLTSNDSKNFNTTIAGVDVSKLAPEVRAAYQSSIDALDTEISNAKSVLDSATATLANDPAAQAAIAMIQQKYDQQISQMKDKNAILAGSYATNAARSGGLQYANDMTSNFFSDEQGRANQRISDLVNQETQLILKAQQAYKSGDLTALNAATKAYESANKDKIDAINKLLDATDKVVKTNQAQQKIDQAASKNAVANDIKVSTALGKTVASQIAASGLKDQGDIDALIQGIADKSGITNIDILKSAVVKAQQDQGKLDLSMENTQNQIDTRNIKTNLAVTKKTTGGGSSTKGGGKDGAYTYTSDDISTYTNFLQQGGKAPDGVTYGGRKDGTDGYVDPGAYVAAYKDWTDNGGTPQGFVKKFPTTNVNPVDYKLLPAAIQPAKSKGGA